MRHAICLPMIAFLLATPALPQGDKPKAKKKEKALILKTFGEEFVLLTPGKGKHPESFTMGSEKGGYPSEKPAHKVTFKNSFAMARYEVTQELYEAVMGDNPSKWKGPRNAVELVTWEEANEFCRKATKELIAQKLMDEGDEIRLPSEAEWEYACRAGTATAFSFGNDVDEIDTFCWYKGNSKGHDPPVGKKGANPWGFYDMHGYNWEWCADGWQENYQKATGDGSPVREADKGKRVIRGGSWADPSDFARSAYREGRPAAAKDDTLGFRCVKAKKGESK
jgi:formylglycine-generating enzyme required for sulfatase activity